MEERIIYRLDDDISFRKCSLFEYNKTVFDDCTNFREYEENWKTYYSCNNYGIHFHCTKHPEIELNYINSYGSVSLQCPKCKNDIQVESYRELTRRCLRLLNMDRFKDAKLIRLDDWYVHEVKEKEKLDSGYWINTYVKTDKDDDTIIVVYIGHKNDSKKAQFFIKPEKLQLSSDHKDLDPAKVLSKIEVTLKDRKLTQEYES